MTHPIGAMAAACIARRCALGCVVALVLVVGALWLAYQLGVIAGTGL